MRITYDPDAEAIYVHVADPGDAGETEVTEDGVIVDTDESGAPRGYELLAVRTVAVSTAGLPAPVARAVEDFVRSGALDSTSLVTRDYGPRGRWT